MSQNFDTSESPRIFVQLCRGDLSVMGSDRRQIAVDADEGDTRIERDGDAFTITAEDDLSLYCPRGATLSIKQVDGDLDIQNVAGAIEIDQARDDAQLREVGPTIIRRLSGDLEARGLQGALTADAIAGDVKVRQAASPVNLQSVRGDLVLREVEAGAVAHWVKGDVSFDSVLATGATYEVQAEGDIAAKVEIASGARFELEGAELHCRIPFPNAERAGNRLVGTLGDGSAVLKLKAGGDLAVAERGETWTRAGEAQWEAAMESWSQQFESQMAQMQQQLEERLANIPFVDTEAITRRAREAAERARRQAERASERGRMRAERSERMGHRHEHPGPRAAWTGPTPPQTPRPPEPPSDQERMTILKMVADKKITAEEAARLLAALEGNL